MLNCVLRAPGFLQRAYKIKLRTVAKGGDKSEDRKYPNDIARHKDSKV